MNKIIHIFEMGGPMMIPLVALALAGITLFFERLLYLHKRQIRVVEFLSGIKTALKNRRILEAITICDETVGPVPRIVKAAIVNSEGKPDIMEQAVNAAAHNQFALIDRRVTCLALVAKTAPLLGLLGTILGILEIFHTIGENSSYVNASELSTGIYNALLTSAFGLLIAIIAWLAYNFINNKVRAIAHDIDWASNEILLFIERGMPKDENLRMEGNK